MCFAEQFAIVLAAGTLIFDSSGGFGCERKLMTTLPMSCPLYTTTF
jgi:hypothetical protein